MELALLRKGLSSIISLDCDTLEQLNSFKGLLSEPISIIFKNMDDENFAKAFEENVHSPFQLANSEVLTFSEKLWVEKYAPCSFTELLSDEQTNREVLLWLKQWDSSVFGSQVRLNTDDVLSALRCHSTIQHKRFSDGKTIFEQGKGPPFSHQKLKPWNIPDRQNENLHGFSASWNKKATVDHPPEQKKRNIKREKAKEKKNRQFHNSKTNSKGMAAEKKDKGKNSYSENAFSANSKVKNDLERRPKSKFHEYLKMEITKGVISAEEDLEMERRMVKKLKLKERKFGDLNVELIVLIEGIPSKLGSKFDDFLVAEHDYHLDGSKIKLSKRKHEDLSGKVEVEKSEKEAKSVAEGNKQMRRKSSMANVKHLEEHCVVDETIDPAEYNDTSNVEEPSNGKL